MKEKYEKLISFMHDFGYNARINERLDEMVVEGTGICNFYHLDSGIPRGLIVETPDITRGFVGIRRDEDNNRTIISIDDMNNEDKYNRISFIINSFIVHRYNMEVARL